MNNGKWYSKCDHKRCPIMPQQFKPALRRASSHCYYRRSGACSPAPALAKRKTAWRGPHSVAAAADLLILYAHAQVPVCVCTGVWCAYLHSICNCWFWGTQNCIKSNSIQLNRIEAWIMQRADRRAYVMLLLLLWLCYCVCCPTVQCIGNVFGNILLYKNITEIAIELNLIAELPKMLS